MTKNELVNRVANRSGYTRQQVSDIIETSMDVAKESLACGHNITLRGFGTFKVLTRKARPVYDFRNKKRIELPTRRVVKFAPYNDLTNSINAQE
jgi:nucleoid DNA-binding protein